MRLEYLIQNDVKKGQLEAFQYEGAAKRILTIEAEKSWSICFSIDGENETIAKKLSALDEIIQQDYKLTTLENGSSAYFAKRLYPLISQFEHLLRKLLYLVSSINPDNPAKDIIKDLESKDFGTIFGLFFTDKSFISAVKEAVNRKSYDYSKAEILTTIESLGERTIWDDLLGAKTVPSLRNGFDSARKYRNAVMHSHRLTWMDYKNTQNLYNKINKELLDAICDITGEGKGTYKNDAFNKTLDQALVEQVNRDMHSGDYIDPNIVQELARIYASYETRVRPYIEQAAAVYEMTMTPELQEQIDFITKIYQSNSIKQLAEAAKNAASISEDIIRVYEQYKDIAPGFQETIEWIKEQREQTDSSSTEHGEQENGKDEI